MGSNFNFWFRNTFENFQKRHRFKFHLLNIFEKLRSIKIWFNAPYLNKFEFFTKKFVKTSKACTSLSFFQFKQKFRCFLARSNIGLQVVINLQIFRTQPSSITHKITTHNPLATKEMIISPLLSPSHLNPINSFNTKTLHILRTTKYFNCRFHHKNQAMRQ